MFEEIHGAMLEVQQQLRQADVCLVDTHTVHNFVFFWATMSRQSDRSDCKQQAQDLMQDLHGYYTRRHFALVNAPHSDQTFQLKAADYQAVHQTPSSNDQSTVALVSEFADFKNSISASVEEQCASEAQQWSALPCTEYLVRAERRFDLAASAIGTTSALDDSQLLKVVRKELLCPEKVCRFARGCVLLQLLHTMWYINQRPEPFSLHAVCVAMHDSCMQRQSVS